MAPLRKVRLDEKQMQAIARAVADPRRFAMLRRLASSESLSCGSLREHLPICAATVSHHLKELSDAGLIDMVREGRTADMTFRREVWEAYIAQLAKL